MTTMSTPERMFRLNLPEWIKLLLIKTNNTGEQLYFSERLKARVYKAYLDCISQALYIELLGTFGK